MRDCILQWLLYTGLALYTSGHSLEALGCKLSWVLTEREHSYDHDKQSLPEPMTTNIHFFLTSISNCDIFLLPFPFSLTLDRHSWKWHQRLLGCFLRQILEGQVILVVARNLLILTQQVLTFCFFYQCHSNPSPETINKHVIVLLSQCPAL